MSSSPDLLPGFGRHLSLSWHFLNFKALRISRLFLWRKLLSLDLLQQCVPFPAWTGLSISNTEGSGTGPIQGDLRALVYLLGVSILIWMGQCLRGRQLAAGGSGLTGHMGTVCDKICTLDISS